MAKVVSTDKDVVSRVRECPRDPLVWGELYRKLRPAVYYTAYKLTGGDRAAAEDLTQDAFFRFIKMGDLQSIANEASATAYLRQITRRLLVDRIRSKRRLTTALELDAASRDVLFDPEDHRLLVEDLEKIASDLPEEDRRLLAWLLEGRSVQDIAHSLLNLPYGTTAVRVHRLRKKIRNIINHLQGLV
jgi:RNA polymerase sigma-70 factor (ECF subfamily)